MRAEDECRISAGMKCGHVAREQFPIHDFKRTLLLS